VNFSCGEAGQAALRLQILDWRHIFLPSFVSLIWVYLTGLKLLCFEENKGEQAKRFNLFLFFFLLLF